MKDASTLDHTFPSIDYATWLAKFNKDSKADNPDALLTWEAMTGLSIPTFHANDNETPAWLEDYHNWIVNNKLAGWQYRMPQHISQLNTETVAEGLSNGADGLWLNDDQGADVLVWANFFKKYSLKNHPSAIYSIGHTDQLLAGLFSSHSSLVSLSGAIYADPVRLVLAHGMQVEVALKQQLDLLEALQKSRLKALGVNGALWANVGLNAWQELGLVLASIHWVVKHSPLSAADVLNSVEVCLGISPVYFVELSKMRAARILLLQLAHTWQVQAKPTPVGGHCSLVYTSFKDVESNLLRYTSAATAAINGSVDFLSIPAHTNQSPSFGQRIARNISNLLKHEGRLEHNVDPAGGSYYFDHATALLAEKAWEFFQNIESAGGILTWAETGALHTLIDKEQNLLLAALKEGKIAQVGGIKFHSEALAKEEAFPTDQMREGSFTFFNLEKASLA